MRRLNLIVPLIVCGVLLLGSLDALAQEAAKPPAAMGLYKVDFALHESEDGKRLNTRNYMLLIEHGRGNRVSPEGFNHAGFGRIRANTKVPISPEDNKVMYMDVGLKIDCDLRSAPDGVLLQVGLEISNFADPQQINSRQPLIREFRTEVSTAVEPSKPTVIAVVDDAATKRRYELEVTVTKVK
jgi:hypothetical protein